ncbi:Hypothetical predicted protein [Paramuricea clavata]|uniref:Uncharacterized protein n=1 Tax=Paramuricea clavata TaxID=317549 RepID=A0A6S7FDM0_PARCT|nr:Hypothetical predicted protein [Paramuricea clavata]
MDEKQYYTLLHGSGQLHPGTNLLYIPKTGKSIEERSQNRICAPPQLNPDYLPSKSVRRPGKLPETRGGPQIDPSAATKILPGVFGKKAKNQTVNNYGGSGQRQPSQQQHYYRPPPPPPPEYYTEPRRQYYRPRQRGGRVFPKRRTKKWYR